DGFQTILRPKNFRTAASYRLGVVVLKGDIPCPMCTQTIDKLGDHATCCSKAGDLIVRHNNLRNLVDRIAQDGQLNPVMEKKGILGPTSGRPGDVSFRLWTQGKGLAIDIAVTSPFTERNVRLEEPCEDYAALQKHAKYDADFKDSDYFFAALVFETTGAINAEGTRVLSQIFRFAACRLGHEFSSYCGRAWARLSCDVQRSVSQAILTRCDGQAGSVRCVSPRESPPVLRESLRESPPVLRESPRESPPVLRESPRGSPRESPPVAGPPAPALPSGLSTVASESVRGASLAPLIPPFVPSSPVPATVSASSVTGASASSCVSSMSGMAVAGFVSGASVGYPCGGIFCLLERGVCKWCGRGLK